MSTAPEAIRNAILARVRAALPERGPATPASAAAGWTEIPREYGRTAQLSLAGRLELLEDRLRDYDAEVTRVAEEAVPETLAAILHRRGNPPVVVPSGFPAGWLPAGCDLTEEAGFTAHELDRSDAVLTTVEAAIA